MYKVRKYTQEDHRIWDDFIDNSKNSTFIFKRDFMEYHKERFEDFSLICFKNNLLVAILPAHKIDSTTIGSHLGLTYGGIVVRKSETFDNILLIIDKLLFYLHTNHIEKLIYKPIYKYYNVIGSDEIAFAKFLIKAKLINRQVSSVINLQHKLRMSHNRTRNIRKASKSGITIKEVKTCGEFWNKILIPNLKTKFNSEPVHSLEEITLLQRRFPNNIRQFNAYMGDKILAGATLFVTPYVARVQYNSSHIKAGNTGASDLLYFKLINNYFVDKNYFDFGTSFDSEGLNNGLLTWKESYGGRSFSIDTYEIEPKNYILLREKIKELGISFS